MWKSRLWLRQTLSLALVLAFVIPTLAATAEENPSETPETKGVTYRVYATREGMVGSTTANGHLIKPHDRFVALPSRDVLSRDGGTEFSVRLSYKGRTTIAPVWDVGPWNRDDNYWEPIRNLGIDLPLGVPEAQTAFYDNYNFGNDERGREVLVPAGIDLADGTFWDDLGMTGNDWVDVTFLWLDQPVALPTDAATPLTGDPGSEYFAETKHNLRGAFREYWRASGELPIFGYPLTEEFTEGDLIVQYFERARFEYHPDLPEGHRVSLTHLGRIISKQRRFAEIPAFPDGKDRQFFKEVNHSLSFGFLNFWENNGGLALFGFPISEEFDSTSSGGDGTAVMQYLERQRFEYHPEYAGTPYAIELGLLGRELLVQKGWLK
ncbi:MAG: SH3 domain-containing protein [Chloroflexi bacterium]|nr:SH3 domain-containing protein [Chloroflexota bacterium]